MKVELVKGFRHFRKDYHPGDTYDGDPEEIQLLSRLAYIDPKVAEMIQVSAKLAEARQILEDLVTEEQRS